MLERRKKSSVPSARDRNVYPLCIFMFRFRYVSTFLQLIEPREIERGSSTKRSTHKQYRNSITKINKMWIYSIYCWSIYILSLCKTLIAHHFCCCCSFGAVRLSLSKSSVENQFISIRNYSFFCFCRFLVSFVVAS